MDIPMYRHVLWFIQFTDYAIRISNHYFLIIFLAYVPCDVIIYFFRSFGTIMLTHCILKKYGSYIVCENIMAYTFIWKNKTNIFYVKKKNYGSCIVCEKFWLIHCMLKDMAHAYYGKKQMVHTLYVKKIWLMDCTWKNMAQTLYVERHNYKYLPRMQLSPSSA